MTRTQTRTDTSDAPARKERAADTLMIMSVEKAFRVLAALGPQNPTSSLSQIAVASGMDVSTTQRFAHTLTKLDYICKDPDSKRFELTPKTLQLGYQFLRSNRLVERATHPTYSTFRRKRRKPSILRCWITLRSFSWRDSSAVTC